MKSLKFDSNAMYQGLEKASVDIVNDVATKIYSDIKRDLTEEAKNDNEIQYANIVNQGYIKAIITNYALAILQSYGVGLGIDESSPFYDDYKSSKFWNPLRHSKLVVGRGEVGSYDTVLGQKTTKGELAGIGLEWISKKATKAIQDVEKEYFDNGKAKELIASKMSEWIKVNSHKYFKYG